MVTVFATCKLVDEYQCHATGLLFCSEHDKIVLILACIKENIV